MTSLEIALTVAFIMMGVIFLFSIRNRRRRCFMRTSDRFEVHHRVREASHELANETTKLRAVTRRISESDDPLRELLLVMTGSRWSEHRGPDSAGDH